MFDFCMGFIDDLSCPFFVLHDEVIVRGHLTFKGSVSEPMRARGWETVAVHRLTHTQVRRQRAVPYSHIFIRTPAAQSVSAAARLINQHPNLLISVLISLQVSVFSAFKSIFWLQQEETVCFHEYINTNVYMNIHYANKSTLQSHIHLNIYIWYI